MNHPVIVMVAPNGARKTRVGFENNHHLPNGEIASGTDELVRSLVQVMQLKEYQPANSETAGRFLGVTTS